MNLNPILKDLNSRSLYELFSSLYKEKNGSEYEGAGWIGNEMHKLKVILDEYGPENIAVNSQLKTPKDIQISLMGLVYRMNDKMNRLVNLVIKNNRNAQNEPVLDSFKDLSVYGIIAQIVERGHWGK